MADTIIQSQLLQWEINVQEGREFDPCKFHKRVISRVNKSFQQWKEFVSSLWWGIWQIGSDDPRRLIHSLKVGLALSLVSIFYFTRPIFYSVGGNAIWGVMTVVVVFEFTVGATFSKGLKRSFATFVAGFLGTGVSYLAHLAGENGGEIVLGFSVFVIGGVSTFARFIPKIKKKCDYGVVIFILTFSLIAISSYRVEHLFEMAYQRLATIIIGCSLCFLLSILVYPIWAGDDLHCLIIRNLEVLAASFEGCVAGCVAGFFESLETVPSEVSHNDKVSNGYKCVLNSKTTEESLANFATWEPCHGDFFFTYPWNEYVKVGDKMRYCAYSVEALNGLLNSEIQAPFCLKEILKTTCMNISIESARILREIAESIRTMTKSANRPSMVQRLQKVVKELHSSMSAQQELFINQNLDVKYLTMLAILKGISKSDTIILPGEKEEADMQSFPCTVSSHGDRGDTMLTDTADKTHQFGEIKRANLDFSLAETLPLAAFACLVIEIGARLERVISARDELAEKAKFKRRDTSTITMSSTTSSTAGSTLAAQGPNTNPIPTLQISVVDGEKDEDLAQKWSCR